MARSTITPTIYATRSLQSDDDYDVYIIWPVNITGFTQTDVRVSAGRIVAFQGINAGYCVSVSPPATGTLNFIVNANAIDNFNNPETTFSDFPSLDTPEPITSTLTLNSDIIETDIDLITFFSFGVDRSYIYIAGNLELEFHDRKTGNFIKRRSLGERLPESMISYNEHLFFSETTVTREESGIVLLTEGVEIYSTLINGDEGQYNPISLDTSTSPQSQSQLLGCVNDILYVLISDLERRFVLNERNVFVYQQRIFRIDINNGNIIGDPIIHASNLFSSDHPYGAINHDLETIFSETTRLRWFNNRLYELDGTTVTIKDYGEIPRQPLARNIPNIVLNEGESSDLSIYFRGVDNIYFDKNIDNKSWFSLNSNGIFSVANSGVEVDSDFPIRVRGVGDGGTINSVFTLSTRSLLSATTPVWIDIERLHIVEGNEINLFNYVLNTNSIAFPDDFSVPRGITLTDGKISVNKGIYDNQHELEISLIASSGSLSTPKIITFVILKTTDEIKDISYELQGFKWIITLEGLDISKDLKDIEEVTTQLDFQEPNEYEIGDCSIILNDSESIYDIRNSSNVFVTQGLNQKGQGGLVTIECAFNVNSRKISRTLFTGNILRVERNQTGKTTRIICVDITRSVRSGNLDSFGQLKQNVELTQSEIFFHGQYEIPSLLRPVSNKSLSGRSFLSPLNIVEKTLNASGVLNPFNATASEDTLTTEGGLLTSPPIVSFNTVLRGERLESVVNQILRKREIFDLQIDVKNLDINENYFRSRGRINYRLNGNNYIAYLKDWKYSSSTNSIYMLVGHRSPFTNDILVRYDISTDNYTEIKQFNAYFETLSFDTADFNEFFIVVTEANSIENDIPPGNYDPSEVETSRKSLTTIWKYTISTNVLENAISPSTDFKIQTSYAHLFGRKDLSFRRASLPNVAPMILTHRERFYYRYSNEHFFGIVSYNRDLTITPGPILFNKTHLNLIDDPYYRRAINKNFCFAIHENYLYLVYMSDAEEFSSTMKIERVNLNTLTAESVLTYTLNSIDTEAEIYGLPYGPLECIVFNNQLFVLLQTEKLDSSRNRTVNIAGQGLLMSVDLTTIPTTDFSRLQLYPYIHSSPHSFTIHNDELFFFTGSPYIDKYPVNNVGEN